MILKKRFSRVIAFILSCILVGAAVFQGLYIVNKEMSKNNKVYNTDKGMNSFSYSSDISWLYDRLLAISNIYLRYTDKNGKFTCSKEMENSLKKALSELDLIDKNGKLILEDQTDFEYYAACGDRVLTNTKKSPNDLDGMYTAEYINGRNKYCPVGVHNWYGHDISWYTTNYGLTYFFVGPNFSKSAVAVYDIDTTEMKSYIDENGAILYYNMDGSMPVPDFINNDYFTSEEANDEALDQFEHENDSENYYIQENISEVTDTDMYMIYDENSRNWLKVSRNRFITENGNLSDITVYVKPSDNLIAEYEGYIDEQNKSEKIAVNDMTPLIPLGIAGIIVGIVLLFCCGYDVKGKKFVISMPDHIYAELPIAVLIGAAVLVFQFLEEIIFNRYAYNDLADYYSFEKIAVIEGLVLIAAYALGLCCLITLVTRLKCKSLWNTSLSEKILSFIWKCIKKLMSGVKKLKNLICIRHIEKNVLRKDIFMRRFIIRTAIVVGLELFLCLITLPANEIGIFFLGSLFILVCYVFFSIRDHSEIAGIAKQIDDMKCGDYSPRIVPENSPAYGMTNNLNNISDGIRTAVDKQVESERMKIELVTNVSHDLKTPLTSIISYIDLLSSEEMSPEAKDYVSIISQKSDRLKSMVSDLFDLAKASSHTDVESEKIDAVILTNQVIGDMSDRIALSGREVRTDIKANRAQVMADGKKIYRVLQNLIDNALKYSMEGTRVYISLKNDNKKTTISVKNISSEEMNFTPEEITERFTRGDKSRTTEGNGLGLSIAKSFTEACDGNFEIVIDGDMFIANVILNLIEE